MNLIMNISHITTVPQMEDFLKNMSGYDVSAFSGKPDVYAFIDATLTTVRYRSRTKKEKGTVKTFLKTVTEYSEVQLKRLLSKSKQDRLKWEQWQAKTACRYYGREEVALLHETDSVHRMLPRRSLAICQIARCGASQSQDCVSEK